MKFESSTCPYYRKNTARIIPLLIMIFHLNDEWYQKFHYPRDRYLEVQHIFHLSPIFSNFVMGKF